MQSKVKKKRLNIVLLSILAFLAVAAVLVFAYLSDYSKAQKEALAVMASSSVKVTVFDKGVAFGDISAEKGFIFYPGGKVEYTAYAPLMQAVAQGNVFCVIPEMPFNLAVFDSKIAEEVIADFPEVEHWYIGGHSLGGAMAADYAGKNPGMFEGLILLAAYSASDISDSELKVLSLYGSEDGVLNKEKYEECLSYLPPNYSQVRIEGGNHAQFGDYGLQDGDGTATITQEEQRTITVEEILKFMKDWKK